MRIDTIIENARITTVDPGRPRAQRVGILGGRIVGFDEELEGVTADSRIDLGGAPVVPGFNDAHFHFSMVGLEMTQLDISPTVAPTLEVLYQRVEEFAGTRPEGAWVRAQGYDQNKLGQHPDREVLDRIAGGRPVYLQHSSHHMAVANTAAFALAGYPDLTRITAPDGGSLGFDERGRFTGLIQEQAMDLVAHVFRPLQHEELIEGLDAASQWCLRNGLTSASEPGVGGRMIGYGPADIHAFQTARDRGLLKTRLTLMPYMDAMHGLGPVGGRDGWGLDHGIRSGLGDEWLRIGPVKVLSDGSLVGRTAAMCCDYQDAPRNAGYLQQDQDTLQANIVAAHTNGWQIAAHAIGDRALDVVLDAFAAGQAEAPRANTRHRIEHVAVASDEQVARIIAGGHVPVPQGRFISVLGDGFQAALGTERLELAYRMRSFVDGGVELPGSTDAPVVTGEPLPSLHDMVNRRSERGNPVGLREALTPGQALRAYTHGSAYAVHEEHYKGMLVRGNLADLVVLSDEIAGVAPERIKNIEVRATMVDGLFQYDAEGVLAPA
ncbi:amidohydrolase [Leucobacter salsicius]|uniref:amidohydrolase n=1 Tax=Leucobacter salsicius TaxID=664638 RepID=UPI0003480C8E|nr:amidohydrolase [Leucobacter salsicius]